MALIGTLAINLTANTGRLTSGLNSSARQVDAWSDRVGSRVESAFAGLASGGVGLAGKAAKGLAGNLAAVSNASSKARTALNFADVGRYLGKASTGVAGLGLAFAGSGDRAVAMRARVAGLGKGLDALGSISKKTRRALLMADVAVFFTKLGTVAGGAFGAMASGFLGVAAGVTRAVVGVAGFGAGLVRASVSTARLVGDLANMAVGLAKTAGSAVWLAASLGRSTSAASALAKNGFGALLSGFSAVQNFFLAGFGFGGVINGVRNVAGGFAQATAGVLRFGVGLGKLGLSAVTTALGGLLSTLRSVAATFVSVAASALKFATVGGVIAGALGVKAAASAAHLNETINTSKQVFEGYADSVVKSAEEMNQAYGTNRKTFLEGANALGGQFQLAGYGAKQSAELSDRILKLAADANASRDPLGGFAEALGKIRSGLSGEQEPLKAWGLDLSDQAVKLEAVSMGLAKQGQELTNAAKVQARLSLITKGLAKDQGALAREATGPAAQISEFWGRASTLMETVGASLAPVLGGALEVVNTAVFALTESWSALSAGVAGFITGAASTVVEWAGAVADFFELGTSKTDLWRVALGFVANAWQMVGIAFKATATLIASDLAVVFKGLSYLGTAIDYVLKKTTGEAAGVGDYLSRLGDKMHGIAVDQAAGLADAWAQPWASATDSPDKLAGALTGVADKVSNAYTAAGDKMAAIRAKLSQPIAAGIAAPDAPNVVAKEAKKKGSEKAFAGAMKLGSTEAASTVLRSRYGAPGKDGTAENTKRSADGIARLAQIQRETNNILRDRAGGVALLGL